MVLRWQKPRPPCNIRKGCDTLDLNAVIQQFAKLCALPPEEAVQQSDLCTAAIAQVESEQNKTPGGLEALSGYAAALAARQFVLRCIATGSVVTIGDPHPGQGNALAAAEALVEDYRRTASRWLRPRNFCFCQVEPNNSEDDNEEVKV